jgi:hypothetical protein
MAGGTPANPAALAGDGLAASRKPALGQALLAASTGTQPRIQ